MPMLSPDSITAFVYVLSSANHPESVTPHDVVDKIDFCWSASKRPSIGSNWRRSSAQCSGLFKDCDSIIAKVSPSIHSISKLCSSGGWDSNPRLLGYEPNELPLLYPAINFSCLGRSRTCKPKCCINSAVRLPIPPQDNIEIHFYYTKIMYLVAVWIS